MGGFNLNLPGLTGEPISGDSLTQYLRSLTNLGGSAGQQFLGAGVGTVNQGLGTTQAGLGTLDKSLSTLDPSIAYYKAILSGDPKALTAATAPTANALAGVYAGANNNTSQFSPAGGFRSSTLSMLPQSYASQVGNYLLGLQPQAANALNTLAGTQAGIGSSQGQIGLGQGQIGLNQSMIGSSLLQQALQALLGRRGQNMTQDTANLGMLTSGLESLVGAGSRTQGFQNIGSDRDMKEGIIPMGEYLGVPVYAFRYKGEEEARVGVIAQEVREIVPEAVHEGADGFLRVDYDLLFERLHRRKAA